MSPAVAVDGAKEDVEASVAFRRVFTNVVVIGASRPEGRHRLAYVTVILLDDDVSDHSVNRVVDQRVLARLLIVNMIVLFHVPAYRYFRAIFARLSIGVRRYVGIYAVPANGAFFRAVQFYFLVQVMLGVFLGYAVILLVIGVEAHRYYGWAISSFVVNERNAERVLVFAIGDLIGVRPHG